VNEKAVQWFKFLAGGGLGVVLAASGFKYLMDEGTKDGDFVRTTVQENTAAMTQAADAMEDVADELKGVKEEIQQVGSDQKEWVASFRPMAREFKNAAEAVTEQVEQAKAEADK
jgi:hypothetical protein